MDEAVRRLLVAHDNDPRTRYKCVDCLDTGWQIVRCPGGDSRECGRPDMGRYVESADGKRSYYVGACRKPHTYAERCTHVRSVP